VLNSSPRRTSELIRTSSDILHLPLLRVAMIIHLDILLARRKMSVTEFAAKVGITLANISVLKDGKAKAIRFSTLEAICQALECQPGDTLGLREQE
jgi:putative transcriptional regulator